MWPSQLCYNDSYSYDVVPENINTLFSSRNTRQRNMGNRRDDIHSVTLLVDNEGLQIFEQFVAITINNGADEYSGPYFVGSQEKTGTLQIVNGEYQVTYISDDVWQVAFNFLVKNRDLSAELSTYNDIVAAGGITNL